MKSSILGIRTIIYQVPDLSNAREWYSKAFQSLPYFNEPFYVGFSIGGYELGLQPVEGSPMEKSENVLAYWGVDNIEMEYERFIQLGASEHEKIQDVGEGIKVASIRDPWGNVIGLIYNPNFKL